MITKAFAIYDHKGLMYGVPFFMLQPGQALRGFMDLVNDPQTSINKHPADYSLYQIGEYEDSDGLLTSLVPHVLLGHALDFKDVPVSAPVFSEPAATDNSKES